MKHLLAIFLSFSACMLFATGTQDLKHAEQIESFSNLEYQVGKFCTPSQCDFFKSPCIQEELQRILGDDYDRYKNHLAVSGSGTLEKGKGFFVLDVSQLHVGGFTSFLYFDPKRETIALFWMDCGVLEKEHQIYGDRPISEEILVSITRRLNSMWGHVAMFEKVDGSIQIKEK